MERFSPDPRDSEAVRQKLAELEGVRRAFVDGPPWQVFLICDSSATNATAVEISARALLAECGLFADDIALQVSFVAAVPHRRRVRFIRAQITTPAPTRSRAEVVLEWEGREVRGMDEGEDGPVAVLRLCGSATLEAIQQIVGRDLGFRILGIKTTRVFDGDLVVVLLQTEQAPDRRLIGASLGGDDLPRGAAVAVLHATNRVLGNYLSVGPE